MSNPSLSSTNGIPAMQNQQQNQQDAYANYAQQLRERESMTQQAFDPYAFNPYASGPYSNTYASNTYPSPLYQNPAYQNPWAPSQVPYSPRPTTPQGDACSPTNPMTTHSTAERPCPPTHRSGTQTKASVEEENKKLKEYLYALAKQLCPPETIENGIKYRVETGNFEVANIDPRLALNITESTARDPETLNRLLKAAANEVGGSKSQDEASRKLGILATTGEMPDFDPATQSYVTYTAQKTTVKAGKNQTVNRYSVAQNRIRFDAQGRMSAQSRRVDPREVDALGQNFDLMVNTPPTALSTDPAMLSNIEALLKSPSFKSLSNQAVKNANLDNLDPATLTAALMPIQKALTTTYGTQDVRFSVEAQSPDGGVTMALYDPATNAIRIYLPALRKHLVEGTGKGLKGDALHNYVVANITASLVHENGHGRQYQALKDPKRFGATTPEDEKALDAYRVNTQVYNNPTTALLMEGDLYPYQHQALEEGVAKFEDLAKKVLLSDPTPSA